MIRIAAVLFLVGASLVLTPFMPGPNPSIAALGPINVEITDSGYGTQTLTIPPNTTVTWVNNGSDPHTVTSDSGGTLDSPDLEPRYSYSYTFHNEGKFPYHDERQPGSTGTIVVETGAEPTPAQTPSPAPTPLPTPKPQPTPTATPAPVPTESGAGAPVRQSAAGVQSVLASSDKPLAPNSVAPSASTTTIEMGNEWFGEPGYQSGVYIMTIQVGDTVNWNVTEGFHNVYECGGNWSDAPGCDSPAWNSELLAEGDSYSQTFNIAGTFDYMCTIHPQTMRGKLVVEAGDSAGQDPTPTPAPIETHIDDDSDADGTPAAAGGSSIAPDPVVAGEAAMPNGGGAPPAGGGIPTTPFFAAAAIAFAASGLIFWRWRHVSAERQAVRGGPSSGSYSF